MEMSYENMRYAVVKFVSDATYSEIPTCWLFEDDDTQKCWWPPRTANCATFIANYTSPNPNSWFQYEVEVIKLCSKYLYILSLPPPLSQI